MSKNNNNKANNNRAKNNNAMKNNNNAKRNNSNNSKSSGSGMSTWIIIGVVILALIGIYFYMQQNRTKEHFSADLTVHEDKAMKLVLFYAPWCGHCKTFKPEWDAAVQDLNGQEINGVNVSLVSVDCDEEKDLATAYNVSGFPTVRCITKDQDGKHEDRDGYNGERSKEAIAEFINEKTNEVKNNSTN